jgi:quercetin dioxygenase-like cupin family protein
MNGALTSDVTSAPRRTATGHTAMRARWTRAATPATVVGAFVLGACASLAAQSAADPGGSPSAAPAGFVRAESEIEWRANPPGTARVGLLARGEAAFVGVLQLAPGAAVPEHRDETEEYIHVLTGGGRMWIDDVAYEVAPGATVYMPARAKVRFQNGDERTTALQVFAGPAPADKYAGWAVVAPESPP